MSNSSEPKPFRPGCGTLLIGGAVLVFLGLFLLPATRTREAAPRSQCRNNLKQIGLALHSYHDQYGCLPPPYVADEHGHPMHSWRVLILPQLEQTKIYKAYRFDEPWNSPHNSKLGETVLDAFRCPSERFGKNSPESRWTSYVAVVGPETCWSETQSTNFRDITDGASNTLLVAEVANSGIHWMEPRDLYVGQMAPTVNPAGGQGVSSPHAGGAQILLGDGTARFVSAQLPAAQLRALLTRNAGDKPGDF